MCPDTSVTHVPGLHPRENATEPTEPLPSASISSPIETQVQDPATEARFVIREETAEIRFSGVWCHLKLTLGLRVLHRLISRQGEDVSVVELVNDRTFEPVEDAEVVDPESLVRCNNRLQAIREEQSAKEERGDLGGRNELAEEEEGILKFLAAITNHRGEPRRAGQNSRARSSVAQALGLLLESLEEKHAQLHAHLKHALVRPSGRAPSYRPAKWTEWVLE